MALCGWLTIEGAALTVSVAAVLVTATPLASVIVTSYSAPETGKELPRMVSVAVVEPLIPEPSLRLLNVLPPSVEPFH